MRQEFRLDGHDYIELHSLLKVTGLCASGGLAKALIATGRVRVDGAVELRKRCKVRTGQMVAFEEEEILVL